jgi:hypothetical protein
MEEFADLIEAAVKAQRTQPTKPKIAPQPKTPPKKGKHRLLSDDMVLSGFIIKCLKDGLPFLVPGLERGNEMNKST